MKPARAAQLTRQVTEVQRLEDAMQPVSGKTSGLLVALVERRADDPRSRGPGGTAAGLVGQAE